MATKKSAKKQSGKKGGAKKAAKGGTKKAAGKKGGQTFPPPIPPFVINGEPPIIVGGGSTLVCIYNAYQLRPYTGAPPAYLPSANYTIYEVVDTAGGPLTVQKAVVNRGPMGGGAGSPQHLFNGNHTNFHKNWP
jgi:hypothetical protein